MDNEKKQQEQKSTVVRPTQLPMTTDDNVRRRYSNIDTISLSPSPLDTRPRIFRPNLLFDSQTYDKILSSVYDPPTDPDDEDDDDEEDEEEADETNTEVEQKNLNQILNDERDLEIEQLTQLIVSQRPIDDEAAQLIMKELNLAIESTKENITTSTTDHHPYPPIHQKGHPIEDHDRPYADYGHLDRATIAQTYEFNLKLPPPPSSSSSASASSTTTDNQKKKISRPHAKSFAITAWTNLSKEHVLDKITKKFGIENLQYVCVSEEISELNHQPHLHIQIIFKEVIDRRKPLIDDITQTCCNYQVTRNDAAWNEYIKKGGHFKEFNDFKSIRKHAPKEWSTSSTPSRSKAATPISSGAAAAIVSTTTDNNQQQPLLSRRPTTRAETEKKRQYQLEIYRQAVNLAVVNVDHAMDLLQREMIDKFLERGTWFLNMFNYIHLRAQREADQRGDIDKEYIWPHSFPDCTPQLHEAMNQWIKHHFSRARRAKCLVLIGPTRTGKTSFAMSLPGRMNYFQERWNLDLWNNYARYSVYDDIPWDDFEKLNFPTKKNLLTQKTTKVNATDKYRPSKEINVRQPAIVLLNPEDAGSLLAEPITPKQQRTAAYWHKNAFIYIMGPDEYFYKRPTHRSGDNHQQLSSSNSSMSANEERMGDVDEWEKMYQRYREKHQ